MNPSVTVGIVTWNSGLVLEACLESLKAQNGISFDLVVVDNNSSDNSINLVKKEFPTAVIIRNDCNTGFCHAHNQAIRNMRGEYYLALNPDVIMAPNFINELVNAISVSPKFGMAGGKLLLQSSNANQNVIDSCGYFLDHRRRQYIRGHGDGDKGQYDRTEEVFGIDGAAPLYRREMLENICINGEYFDESFFAHKEDIDLAWRSQIAGWKAIYTPRAVATHVRSFRPGNRSGISAEIRRHAVKNRYLLILKNEAICTWKRDWPKIIWYDLKILGYLILRERSSLSAISSVYRSWGRIRSWREDTWRQSKVLDSDIMTWFVDPT